MLYKVKIVKYRFSHYVLGTLLVTSCAIPKIDELRSMPSNEQFTVNASMECLYNKGVEHVSSYIGMNEPKFTWYTDSSHRYSWFRQPLTLIEMKAKGDNEIVVERFQTSSAESFGQGNDLVEYLKLNPCGN